VIDGDTYAASLTTTGTKYIWLGSKDVNLVLGSRTFTITVPRQGFDNFSATATASNGDTSEVSPTVSLGQSLTAFTTSGSVIQAASVTSSGVRSDDDMRGTIAHTAAIAHVRYRGEIDPFCPPKTNASARA
jgi:hypothetical protein